MTQSKKSKGEARWDDIVSSMPKTSKEPEPEKLFDSIVGQLPVTVPTKPETRFPEPSDAQQFYDKIPTGKKWCVCEQVEGEFPRIRLFPTLADLTQYMACHEGEEVTMWPFLGAPLPFTKPDKNGRRLLCVPDNMWVTIEKDDVWDEVDPPDDVLEQLQLDGWLGPKSMSEQNSYFLDNDPKKEKEASSTEVAESENDDEDDQNEE